MYWGFKKWKDFDITYIYTHVAHVNDVIHIWQWISGLFPRYQGFLFVNMAAISYEHGLHPVPEGRAHIGHVGCVHGLPLLLDRGLQGFDIWVAVHTGHGLDVPPHPIINWVQVRVRRRPELLWPWPHVVCHPFLNNVRHVGRCVVLLEDIGCLPSFLDFFQILRTYGGTFIFLICKYSVAMRQYLVRNHTGGILAPVETTTPNIITLAGCLVLLT